MVDRKDKNKTEPADNETHERIMVVAQELFAKRGYAAVTLRDIATAVGMRQASLYYYAPEGKEQLFIEVMKRTYTRHRQGLEQAIVEAGPEIADRLRAMAKWLLSQPPADYTRLFFSDIPAIEPTKAEWLGSFADSALITPVETVIAEAVQAGKVAVPDVNGAAHIFIALIQDLHNVPERHANYTRAEYAEMTINMILYGWYKR